MGVLLLAALLQSSVAIEVTVTSDTGPVPRAQVIVAGKTVETDGDGRVTVQVLPGPVQISVVKTGFNPMTVAITAVDGAPQTVAVILERQTAIEEHVTVSATRTDKRLEDQPMRVEVLNADEIQENLP